MKQADFVTGAVELFKLAEQSGQRPLLWLAATQAESLELLNTLFSHHTITTSSPTIFPITTSAVWVSRAFAKPTEPVARFIADHQVSLIKHQTHLLGGQAQCVIYDAHDGFDPNLFCVAAGALQGGGVLVLLTPPFQNGKMHLDADYQRMVVYPHQLSDIKGHFMDRMYRRFKGAATVACWNQRAHCWWQTVAMPLPESRRNLNTGLPPVYNEDQQAVIEHIDRVVFGHRQRPLVIAADRGRGKSAALGAALARVVVKNRECRAIPELTIAVTAPNEQNTRVVLQHCAWGLNWPADDVEQVISRGQLKGADFHIYFIPPDELLSPQRQEDHRNSAVSLLLVDEAAAIPEATLMALTERFSRIVFASTIHGYEGTGRGFAIRFQPYLDNHFPGGKQLRLTTPIRWGDNDALEALLNEIFLLQAEYYRPDFSDGHLPDQRQVREVTQQELAENADLLSEVFGLLVQAHYRTRPSDLRDVMDGLNLRLWILCCRGELLGCCLVAEEGELDDDILDAIFAGQRRPRGHLLPQTICQCLGVAEIGKEKVARIVRIAVAPEWQQRGLGSELLTHLESAYRDRSFIFIGSSFAAHGNVVRFWRKNLYQPIRLGFTKETSSGAHSLLVLKSLGNEAADRQVVELHQRFCRDFPLLIASEFWSVPSDSLLPILEMLTIRETGFSLSPSDTQQIQGFLVGSRTFADARAAIWRFLMLSVANGNLQKLRPDQQALLVEVILKQQSIKTLASLQGIAGKRDGITKLRQALTTLVGTEI